MYAHMTNLVHLIILQWPEINIFTEEAKLAQPRHEGESNLKH